MICRVRWILPSVVFLAVAGVTLWGLLPAARAQGEDDTALATRFAQELIAASPVADPADAAARDRSALLISRSTLLRDAFAESFLWGTQRAPGLFRPQDSNLTRFSPLVWRKMYLSLFMVPGEFRIERAEPYTVLRVACQFRNRLEAGLYPYPFWHSAAKWESWEQCLELLFVFEKGKVIAILRSAEKDPVRPHEARVWDGKWHWSGARGQTEPRVALYRWLFTAKNPHVKALEAAYRALEAGMRKHQCGLCHSPNNAAEMNPLRLLNYPNQALTERHSVVVQLEQNAMPPGEGIVNARERKGLLDLAKRFAAAGDKALAFEGEVNPVR
jgi:hypothetical protein